MQKPEPCFVRCSAAVSRKQQLNISPRRSSMVRFFTVQLTLSTTQFGAKFWAAKTTIKSEKFFLVKLSDICFIGEGKKNPSKPSNCSLEFEHSDIHLPATQILNRGLLQKFFWISMWNIQGKWSFFNVNIIFSFFKRIWTLKFLTWRRRVLCIFIPMGI